MQEQFSAIVERFEEITFLLTQPEIVGDQPRYRQLMKEFSQLEGLVGSVRELETLESQLGGAQQLLDDPQMRELAQHEIGELDTQIAELRQSIRLALLPRDPNDGGNAVLEIRAGTGGEEAALFGADLLRMYNRYADGKRWQFSLLSVSETDIGGIKEAVCLISGSDVFAHLKYESGVHRVQRVPETESGGRIHTSAATVAVLPESQDVDVQINPGDLRIDTYRSGGAGGQHVNKTESAVRITHLATGIVAICQDEKSQIKNREKAMRVLSARLYDHFNSQQQSAEASARRAQIGSGDRSERIRTYNFPQNRITDHRINLTLYALGDFIQGGCDAVIEPLRVAEQTLRLQSEA